MKSCFVSGTHNPSGVIGWSWEMMIANQIFPDVVLSIFSVFVMQYLICTDFSVKSEVHFWKCIECFVCVEVSKRNDLQII